MAMTSEQFKERRKELRMTQSEVAEALGLAERTVQYYESPTRGLVNGVPRLVEREMMRLKPRRARIKRARAEVVNG